MFRMTAISHRQIIEQSIAREITDTTPVALTLITDDNSCSTEVNCTPGDKPLFLAYSCTKTIIATLFLMLCEEGRCSLDASVSRWFPELPIDIVVNNAGITGFEEGVVAHDPEQASLESWHTVHWTNLDGVFLGCKYTIRTMRRTGTGSNINISSRSGMVGVPTAAVYASSKAAVRNHTKTVALYYLRNLTTFSFSFSLV